MKYSIFTLLLVFNSITTSCYAQEWPYPYNNEVVDLDAYLAGTRTKVIKADTTIVNNLVENAKQSCDTIVSFLDFDGKTPHYTLYKTGVHSIIKSYVIGELIKRNVCLKTILLHAEKLVLDRRTIEPKEHNFPIMYAIKNDKQALSKLTSFILSSQFIIPESKSPEYYNFGGFNWLKKQIGEQITIDQINSAPKERREYLTYLKNL